MLWFFYAQTTLYDFSMGKLKDAHIFSNEEGSIAKFFVTAATYAAAMYASHILTSIIEKEPFKWLESL